MGMLKMVIPTGKHRILSVAFLAAAALFIGCSNAAAPERPTAIPRSPAPPAADLSATVDALVQQRLSEVKPFTLRTPVVVGPSAEPLTTPTALPEGPTPVRGDINGTATPEPTPSAAPTSTVEPTVVGTPTLTPTITPVPTSTPTFDDDHGDDRASATKVTFEESPLVITGEIDVLDDIDFFEIFNTVPDKTWIFTPEYLPPETASGRFPTIAIIGASAVPDPFTGVITFIPGGSNIYLSVSSEIYQKTGDYRVVVDRTVN